MKKLIAVLLILFSASILYAEYAVVPAQVENLSLTDESIDYFLEKSYVKVYLIIPSRSMSIDLIKNDKHPNNKIDYFPNSNNIAGVEINFYHIGVAFSTDTGSSGESNKRLKGSTDYRDLMLSYYTTNFGAELSYQKYNGFYLQAPELHGYSEGDPATIRSDLELMNIGGRVFYNIVDLNTYSIAAVCNQSERQKDFFAVAFLVMLSADKSSIDSDYSLIPPGEENDYGKFSGFRGGEFFSIGIAPGIGAVMSSGVFYSAFSLFIGGGYQSGEYKVTTGYIKDKTTFLKNHLQLSTGFSGDTFIAGMNSMVDINSFEMTEKIVKNHNTGIDISLVGWRAEFFGGMRF